MDSLSLTSKPHFSSSQYFVCQEVTLPNNTSVCTRYNRSPICLGVSKAQNVTFRCVANNGPASAGVGFDVNGVKSLPPYNCDKDTCPNANYTYSTGESPRNRISCAIWILVLFSISSAVVASGGYG